MWLVFYDGEMFPVTRGGMFAIEEDVWELAEKFPEAIYFQDGVED